MLAQRVRKMAKSWLRIISRLKKLIKDVGPLWPDSTKLAGFGSDGPYHCSNCIYLKGFTKGEVFKDEKGYARCSQAVMLADLEVGHDEKGLAIITDPGHQCCEFVEPPKKKEALVKIETKV